MPRNRNLSCLVVAAVLLLSPSLLLAENAQEAIGFTPNHVLVGDAYGETIDQANGNVNLSIPIGPSYQVGPRLSYRLTLSYASLIWRSYTYSAVLHSELRRDGPFGVGFALNLGRIERMSDVSLSPSGNGFGYLSSDGAMHPIGSQNAEGYGVTTDGTFIRAKREGPPDYYPTGWTLTFPDATIAVFEEDPDADPWSFRLKEYRSPEETPGGQPAYWVRVHYSTDPVGGVGTWRCIAYIEDSTGRTITFTNVADDQGGHTTKITQPVFDVPPLDATPPTADWWFYYDTDQTLTSPDPLSGVVEDERFLLSTVTFPANPAVLYEFDYTDPVTGVVTDGMLRRRYVPWDGTVPERSYYQYAYEDHEFDVREWVGDRYDYRTHYTRVVNGKLLYLDLPAPEQDETRTWSWAREYDGTTYGSNPVRVDATDPEGHVTVYKFHGSPYAAGATDDGTYATWQTGLPRRTEYPLGQVEIQEYDSEWLCPLGACFEYPQVTESWSKRQAESGAEWVVKWRLGLDDYGHASDVVVYGEEPGLYRRTHTDWTVNTDTEEQDAWFIHGWSSKFSYDEEGKALSGQQAVFDPTGLLLESRALANPAGGAQADDVVSTNTYDVTKGLLMSTTRSGGDGGSSYTATFEYQADVADQETYLARSRSGTLDWYSGNRDVDWATGLTRRAIDPNDELPGSGVEPGHLEATEQTFALDTTYEWDAMGRLTAIKPPGVAPTLIYYDSLYQTRVEQCKAVGECRKSIYTYDTLRRLVKEERLRRDGGYDTRKTTYDWAGRLVEQTEWLPPNWTTEPTTYYSYDMGGGVIDPQGRVWQITAPDGTTTSFTYTDQVKTATVNVDGTDSTTTWTTDAFGRLIEVDAPLGADATYRYDAAGRLLRAELTDGGDTQVRSFEYDALGRLRSTYTPEGGTVHVEKYDPAGNPMETADARGRHLETTYDAAGRVLELRYVNGPLLARNTYDTDGSGDPTRAKLVKAESFDDWGNPVSVTSFVYDDPYGRVSEQRQQLAAWQGLPDALDGDPEMVIDYTYDAWGELSSLGYPLATGGNRLDDQISHLYYQRSANGWLEGIQDLVRLDGQDPLELLHIDSYHAAGAPETWTVGNGVQTTLTPDVMFRPEQIQVGTGGSLWDSGQYAYDAAGNITAMGTDVFHYDLLGRLTQADIHFNVDGQGGNELMREDYTYDAFGNMLTRMQSQDTNPTRSMTLDVDPNTNRILSVNTDPQNPSETHTLTWDPSGNLIQDPTMFEVPPGSAPKMATFRFDGRGRLMGMAQSDPLSDPLWTERSQYDAGGLRLARTDEATGLTTFFLRDASGQVLSEYTKPAESSSPPVWSRDFYYGLGGTLAVAQANNPDPPVGLASYWTKTQGTYDVTVSWDGPAEGTDPYTYRVYRKAPGESSFSMVGSEVVVWPGNRGTYQDLDLSSGLYAYLVRRVEGDPPVEGEDSRILLVDAGPGFQSSASGLTAEVVEGAVRLSWDRASNDVTDDGLPVTSFLGYQVQRQVPVWGYVDLTNNPIREASFVDPTPPEGTTVNYKVLAMDTHGIPAETLVSIAVPARAFPPSAPGGLLASAGPDEFQATLAWQPAPGDEDVQVYRVYEKVGSSWVFLVPQQDVTITGERAQIHNLTPRTTYEFTVTAVDSLGAESERSATVRVRPALENCTPGPTCDGLPRPSINVLQRTATTMRPAGTGDYVNFYRRDEGSDPNRYLRRNASLVWTLDKPIYEPGWSDQGLEECKAYVYVASEAETTWIDGTFLTQTGDESAVSYPLKVDRNLIAVPPHLEWNEAREQFEATWSFDGGQGVTTCAAGEGTDYFISEADDDLLEADNDVHGGWFLFRQECNSSTAPASMVELSLDPFRAWEFLPFTAPDDEPYWYTVQVVTFNLRESTDNWRSPLGEGVCFSTASGELAEGLCDCGTGGGQQGGGGGGGEPPVEDPPPPQMHKLTNLLGLPTYVPPGEGAAWRLASLRPIPPEVPAAEPTTNPEPAPPTPPTPTRKRLDLGDFEVYPVIVTGQIAITPGSPVERGVSMTYLHSDHLGTTRVATDENGTVTMEAASMPFGDPLVQPGQDGSSYFGGHLREEGNQAVYMMARYYSPALGRFLSADPLLDGNRFTYVANNPIALIDPQGTKWQDFRGDLVGGFDRTDLFHTMFDQTNAVGVAAAQQKKQQQQQGSQSGTTGQGVTASYWCSRPLDEPSVSWGFDHQFLVNDAAGLGDSNATVRSFGDDGTDHVGEVSATTTGFSATTNAADIAAWESLATGSPQEGVECVELDAPDALVTSITDNVVSGIVEYSAVPEVQGGANSNSVPGAVAQRAASASGTKVPKQPGSRISPGAAPAVLRAVPFRPGTPGALPPPPRPPRFP